MRMPIWYGIQNTQMRVGDEIIADYEIAIVIDPGEEVEKIVIEIKERGLIISFGLSLLSSFTPCSAYLPYTWS